MRRFGFVVRRARSGPVLLVALLAVTAVLTGSLGVIVATADAVLDRGVRQVVAEAPATATGVQVQTKLTDDAAAQNDAVEEAIATAFPEKVMVTRAVRSAPVDAERQGVAFGVVLLAGDGVVDGAELVGGEWPARGSRELVFHATAAQRLGVEPGDSIRLGEQDDWVVSGLWLPRDETDPRWFGDPTVASGFEGEDALVVVDESGMAQSSQRPSVAWTIVPDRFDVASLDGYGSGVERLRSAVQDLGSAGGESWRVTGSLTETLARAASAAASGRALLIVPLVLLSVLGATAAFLVARALAVARRDEEALLRSRGRSRRRQVTDDLLETGPVALAGVIVGSAAAALIISASGIPIAATALPFGLVAFGVIVVVVGAATLTPAVVARAPRREDAGRGTVLAVLAPLAVLAIPAALALAQLLARGSLTRAGSDGTLRVDTVAVAAPALTLVATAALLVVVALPVLGLAQRLAARRPGLAPALPLRQLARRGRSVAAGLFVVALGAGALTFTAAHQTSADQADAARVRLATGGDVRILFAPASGEPDRHPAAEYADLPHVDHALDVTAGIGSFGGEQVPVLIVDPAGLAELDPAFAQVGAFASSLSASDSELPVLLTTASADRAALDIGDRFSLRLPGRSDPSPVVVVGIVPPLPVLGSPLGMLVDPAAVAEATGTAPIPTEVWLAASDPATAAAEAREATTRAGEVQVRTQYSTAAIGAPVSGMLWAGAAVGTLLTMVAFTAIAAGGARGRAGERRVLLAVGLDARSQRRLLLAEFGGMAGVGLALGVLAGGVVAALVVPALVGGSS